MNSNPIERRLCEYASGEGELLGRAGQLLRQLPEPSAPSEAARRSALVALRSLRVGSRRRRWGTLQPTVILATLVFSVAASATRGWWKPLSAESVTSTAPPAVPAPPAPPVAPAPVPRSEVRQPEPPLREAPIRVVAPAPPKASRALGQRASANVKPAVQRPRLLSDPQQSVNRPIVPLNLAREADGFSTLLEVCVDTAGTVTRVNVLHPEDPILDQRIALNVQGWKYAPAEVKGRPVPMCFALLYRLRVEESYAQRTP